MSPDELNKFIEYAKSIIEKTNFRFLKFESIQPEITHVGSIIRTGKTVPVIYVCSNDDDNTEGSAVNFTQLKFLICLISFSVSQKL